MTPIQRRQEALFKRLKTIDEFYIGFKIEDGLKIKIYKAGYALGYNNSALPELSKTSYKDYGDAIKSLSI